jgi:hypothetical protein
MALFVALGGASYAAATLPANSVHQRQLAFPLGLASKTIEHASSLPISVCSAGIPCPAPTPRSLVSVVVSLKQPTKLVVFGSAGFLHGSSVPATDAVQLSVGVEAHGSTSFDHYQLDDAHPTLHFWQTASVPTGRHVIRFVATAQATRGPVRNVHVNTPSLAVLALPAVQ